MIEFTFIAALLRSASSYRKEVQLSTNFDDTEKRLLPLSMYLKGLELLKFIPFRKKAIRDEKKTTIWTSDSMTQLYAIKSRFRIIHRYVYITSKRIRK
jgi:hypothetical protein